MKIKYERNFSFLLSFIMILSLCFTGYASSFSDKEDSKQTEVEYYYSKDRANNLTNICFLTATESNKRLRINVW